MSSPPITIDGSLAAQKVDRTDRLMMFAGSTATIAMENQFIHVEAVPLNPGTSCDLELLEHRKIWAEPF